MNHQQQGRAVHFRRALAARQAVVTDDGVVTRTVVRTVVQTSLVLPTTATPIIPPILRPTVTTPILRPTVTPPILRSTVTPPRPIVTPTPVVSRPPPVTTPATIVTTSATIITTSATIAPATTAPVISTSSSTPVVIPTPTTSLSTASAPPRTSNRALTTSQTSSPSSTPSSAPTSGSSNTGAIVGGIGGGLVGVGVIAFVVFFFIRRYRRKDAETAAFNATKFRRSAIVLDDPPAAPPKDNWHPRPPSMIERRMQSSTPVPVPPASYPYGEQAQYSADPYGQYSAAAAQYNMGQYGADGQMGRDRFGGGMEQYGGNLSGAVYGQHASYGDQSYGHDNSQYTQHKQYQQQPQAQYPNYYQNQAQQYSFTPGEIIPSATQRSSPPPSNSLPNPFSQTATSTTPAAAVIAAARAAAHANSQVPSSISAGTAQTHLSSSTSSSSSHSDTTIDSGAVYLNRHATQSSGAPPAYQDEPRYADMQRDVKVKPVVLRVQGEDVRALDAGASSTPTGKTQTERPVSTFTMYDPADAYGGI